MISYDLGFNYSHELCLGKKEKEKGGEKGVRKVLWKNENLNKEYDSYEDG